MKALIAMSGGVDSSVAAYLMCRQNFDCIGCTMKLYNNEDIGINRKHTCCSLDDVEDARSVAHKLGMPYYVFNFTDCFKDTVIEKFVKSYENGITPNPCIDCNRYLKFDKLYTRAKVLGCDYIVTGHYARIEKENGKFSLKKAIDRTKDQSYVLYSMTQQQLASTLFPLGNMTKTEVRQAALQNGFINAEKPDSQDICFVPDGDYGAFLSRYTGKDYKSGNFVLSNGKVIGKHRGITNYTVGQRKGLGISYSQPLYVCKICTQSNDIVLGTKDELLCDKADVCDFNWISGEVPQKPFRAKVKIRYRAPEEWATVTATCENEVSIVFDKPQRAVTPGQAAVVYDGDTVIGGGTIKQF